MRRGAGFAGAFGGLRSIGVARRPLGTAAPPVRGVGAFQPPRPTTGAPAIACKANAKAIRALVPEATARELLPDRLPRHTPHTHTTRKALLAELEEVRRTSIAFDREEHTEGISAVGFAVRHGPATIAAITVPMPTARFDDREAEIVAAVLAAREEALAAISASA